MKTKYFKLGKKSQILSTYDNCKECYQEAFTFLVKKTDKMNFKSVEKIVSPEIFEALKRIEGSEATSLYLKALSYIIDAYIDKQHSVDQRIYKMAFAVFFFRIWKAWIKQQKQLKISQNFISSNAYVCIELNFHSLIVGYWRFRENSEMNPFTPWLWSSQPCKKFFRLCRSMTSTYHTRINFDSSEFMEHTKKAQFLQSSMASLEESHIFPRENNRKLGYGNLIERIEILNNQEISSVVLKAKDDLLQEFKRIGISEIRDGWWKLINIKEAEIDEREDGNEAGNISCDNLCETENYSNDFHVHPEFASSIKSLNLPDYQKMDLDDEFLKNSKFCKLNYNQKEYVVRKSTLVWLISPEAKKLSSDRSQRFVGEKNI